MFDSPGGWVGLDRRKGRFHFRDLGKEVKSGCRCKINGFVDEFRWPDFVW